MRIPKGRHIVPLQTMRNNRWGVDALDQGSGKSYDDNIQRKSPYPVSLTGLDMFAAISGMSWEKSEKYRLMLPKKEQDILILIYQHGKFECDIAKMMSLTQGAVAARLRRALKRIKFFRHPPDYPEPIPLTDNPTPKQIKIFIKAKKICDLIKAGTMHQVEIAKKLEIAQCTVSDYCRNRMLNPPKNQKFYYINTELQSPRYKMTPRIVFAK
jgi:predicted transcriptional regulator